MVFCREVPIMETQRVASFLRDLLTCDFDAMPVEASTHMQVYSSNTSRAYVDCLSSLNFSSCRTRNNSMSGYCGIKFGIQPEDRMQMCSQLLSNSDSSDSPPGVADDLVNDFKNYRSCRERYQDTVRDRCYSTIQAICREKSLACRKGRESIHGKYGILARNPSKLPSHSSWSEILDLSHCLGWITREELWSLTALETTVPPSSVRLRCTAIRWWKTCESGNYWKGNILERFIQCGTSIWLQRTSDTWKKYMHSSGRGYIGRHTTGFSG